MEFELYNEHELYEEVTIEVLKSALDDLTKRKFNYLILDVTPALNNNQFIQVKAEKDSYRVETRFEYSETDFQQFCQYFTNSHFAEKLFLDYFHQKLPEIDTWEDITMTLKTYFDDPEEGMAPETSHPSFVVAFQDAFYYSGMDEEAPFGSDAGNDAFAYLEDFIQKDGDLEELDTFPKKIIEEMWGMTYYSPLVQLTVEELKQYEMDIWQTNQVTIAVGFGAIKILGEISDSLKQQTLAALTRLNNYFETNSELYLKQLADLEKFAAIVEED